MRTRLLQDPRRYLLVVLALSLILIVPLLFLLVTLVGQLAAAEGTLAIAGWTVWLLLAVVAAALLVGAIMVVIRGTEQAEREDHDVHPGGHEP